MKHGESVRLRILNAGVKLWEDDPIKVNSVSIAREICMTPQGVMYYFSDGLREEVAKYAVEIGASRVIVQLLAINHPLVKDMPKAERLRHMAVI